MLTDTQLQELQRLSALFYTITESAIILQVDKKRLRMLIQDEVTPESQYYNRGLLLSEKEVREKIIEMALRGSTKAQAQVMDLINETKLDNDGEENS